MVSLATQKNCSHKDLQPTTQPFTRGCYVLTLDDFLVSLTNVSTNATELSRKLVKIARGLEETDKPDAALTIQVVIYPAMHNPARSNCCV